MENRGPKETAYDESISPLIAQVIKLCKEHNIATFMRFYLDVEGEEDEALRCTTQLPISEFDGDNKCIGELAAVERPHFSAFTITTARDD